MERYMLHILLCISLSLCIMSCDGDIKEEYVRENPNITTRTIDNRAPELHESKDYQGFNRDKVWYLEASCANFAQLQYKDATTTDWKNYWDFYSGGIIGSDKFPLEKKGFSYGEVRLRLRNLDDNLSEYINSVYPISGKVSPWCNDVILFNNLLSDGTTINENMIGIVLKVKFEGSGGIKTLKRTALSRFQAEATVDGKPLGSVSCIRDDVPSGYTEQYVFTEPKYAYLSKGSVSISIRNLNKNNLYLSEWSELYTSITVKSGNTLPAIFNITVKVLKN